MCRIWIQCKIHFLIIKFYDIMLLLEKMDLV